MPKDPKELGLHRAWLSPFTPEVRGGLRGKMNQFTDGEKTILTPKAAPTSERRTTNVIPMLQAAPTPVCNAVQVDGVLVDPPDNPLTLGVEYTFSADGLTGSTPFVYMWFLNGAFQVSTPTFVHTIVDGDVQNKDGSGLGVVFVFLAVGNACGIDVTNPLATFPAQGTP